MADSNASASGIGLHGLLGVVFVTLKLCNVIDWPWFWVLSPFWIPLAVLFALLGVMGIAFFFVWMFTGK